METITQSKNFLYFVENFLLRNTPCLLDESFTSFWKSRKFWQQNGQPDLIYLDSEFGTYVWYKIVHTLDQQLLNNDRCSMHINYICNLHTIYSSMMYDCHLQVFAFVCVCVCVCVCVYASMHITCKNVHECMYNSSRNILYHDNHA